MTTGNDIYNWIDQFAPFETQEDFDNAGYLIGDRNQEIRKALVALDATRDVIEEGRRLGVDLIVTHHPIIFHPMKQLMKTDLPYLLATYGIGVISAHTNLDKAQGGVNDALAAALGLKDTRSFEGSEEMGRIGELDQEMEPAVFASHVKECLGGSGLRYVPGSCPVRTVAVLGGGGDFAVEAAEKAGAQALVTGEAKHHILLDAADRGFTFVDAGHFETEQVVCPILCQKLRQAFPDVEWQLSGQRGPAVYLGD